MATGDAARSGEEVNAELRAALRRLRSDPVAFARVVLGLRPWSLQEEVLQLVARNSRVAVAGAHAVGKDWLASVALLWYLFTRPKAIVLSTAPTERQTRKLLWAAIHSHYRAARLPLGGVLRQLAIEISTDWYALGFTAVGPDQFQGFHAPSLMVVVDEAAGVPPAIYQGVDAVLTGEDSRLLLLGNPTSRRGPFFEAFHADHVASISIPATAHPNVAGGAAPIAGGVSKAWIRHVRDTYGESSPFYLSRVLAQFPTDDLDALVPADAIASAMSRDAGTAGQPSAGLDVARFGSDATVLVVAQGGTITRLSSWRRTDLVHVADIVARAIADHHLDPALVAIDDTGLGGGVTDILRFQRDLIVRPVNFATKARRPDRFANIKSEMFWNLRELLRLGAVALGRVADSADGRILAEQLSLLTSELTAEGPLRVAGEPGHLAAPSTSPDHATALALALLPLRARDIAVGPAR